MAAGAGSPATSALALAALPSGLSDRNSICSNSPKGSKPFEAGAGALRRAVGDWYTERTPRELAHQLSKYQKRDGWSHQDLLRMCHVKASEPSNTAMRWAVGHRGSSRTLWTPHPHSRPIVGFEACKRAATVGRGDPSDPRIRPAARVCADPLADRGWRVGALLETMPLGALVRNLATMTRVGLLTAGSAAVERVVLALADTERLKRSRLHPIALLAALRTYHSGRGVRGSGFWSPVSQIVDALG